MLTFNRVLFVSALTITSTLLLACDSKTNNLENTASENLLSSPALAKVGDEIITEEDVHNTIEKTFSNTDKLFLDEAIQTKVLESLIASKAMRQQMLAELDQESLQDIKSKAEAYEEELYVKAYLQQYATPEPVTSQMVEEYYNNNPEKFGGGVVKQYEQLIVASQLSDAQRDELIKKVDTIKSEPDWKSYADSNTGFSLIYKSVTATPGLLPGEMENILRSLSPGETSNLFFVNGNPAIIRVTSEQKLPAKPLTEVSAEIRKALSPIQLRKAAQEVTKKALETAKVERY